MATPTPPNGNNGPKQSSVSGNGAAPIKPRATIVMKNPNANPASQPRIPAAGGPPPGSSARIPAARSAPSVRKVQVDREALGLSAARPSEMIAGLDEAAKRAEALAAREEAKRKSGGKMSANLALHVDDTGRKWSLWVRLGIVAVLAVAAAAGWWMYTADKRHKVGDREGLELTRKDLKDLGRSVELMDLFKEGESISVQDVKERLRKRLDADLEAVKARIARDRATGRNPDRPAADLRDQLERQLNFKDAWGKPLEFAVEGDELSISSTSTAKAGELFPVRVRIRSTPSKPPEKDEKVKGK